MYELNPKIKVNKKNLIIKGNDQIYRLIDNHVKNDNVKVIYLETYPGFIKKDILNTFKNKDFNLINVNEIFFSSKEVKAKIHKKYITDDRVFGYMYPGKIDDFISLENKAKVAKKIDENKVNIIYGFGATKVSTNLNFLTIYYDLSRWEIQKRYRQGLINSWKDIYNGDDPLQRFKVGYFFEWRIADKLKEEIWEKIDYFIDLNGDNYKLLDAQSVFEGLKTASKQPFRTVPYFDTGCWGGQWMKEKFNLDKSKSNFAWAFDGVPEENSIFLEYGTDYFEMPAINLVLFYSQNVLGKKVIEQYGKEFPIRFDYLDTIAGGNLSLQVHPLTKYIQTNFGMKYTQDESYYILDAKEDAYVYLGLKDNTNVDEFLKIIKTATNNNENVNIEKYINKIPAKKHDHFLIPSGTIHCSGKNVIVLEISCTPYIFTFKIWDWNRLGLDGKPRPVHLEHAKNNIVDNRREAFVYNELVNNTKSISKNITNTGMYDAQPITTLREYIKKHTVLQKNDELNMLNLVEGKAIKIKATNNEFEPIIINYGETFIIPAACNEVLIENLDEHCEALLLRAFIK